MDVNKHEKLSNFTCYAQINLKEQHFHSYSSFLS